MILEGSFGGNQMGSWGWGGAGNADTSAKAPDAWNMATNWAAAPPPPPPEPAVVSKACLLMISVVKTIIVAFLYMTPAISARETILCWEF